nr:hypothetical protein [Tanacetum cinerariifolium]
LTTIAGQRWIISRGFRLAVMKCLQSLKYVAALGAAIGLAIVKGMQTGLVAGIDHGKAIRGLANVFAYDHSEEVKYVSAVLAFRDLDFNLLSQLESQKDASIADIMGLLHLEGPIVETLEETSLSDSLDVVHAHVQKTKEASTSEVPTTTVAITTLAIPATATNKEDNVVIGETSLSDSLDVVHAHVQKTKEASTSEVPTTTADITTLAIPATATNVSSISPISVADYDVQEAEPHNKAPHSSGIRFEKEDLETTLEHLTAS